jgi:hypothetical protein
VMRSSSAVRSSSLGAFVLCASVHVAPPAMASQESVRPGSERRVVNLRSRGHGRLQTVVEDKLQVVVLDQTARKDAAPGLVYSVTLALTNIGAHELHNLRVTAAGAGLERASSHVVAALRAGAQTTLNLEYRAQSDHSLEQLDPQWDENVPVSAELSFRDRGRRRHISVPIDYRFYAGWYSPSGDAETILGAIYADQPGLLRHVEDIRAEVGPPPYETAESRVRAAQAVSGKLRELGLTYREDPSYLRGERAAFAYQQFPTETLYFGGDCEDLSILYGFFLHQLGVPFAIASSVFHVAPLVELGRGELSTATLAGPLGAHVISRSCAAERCHFLPVDPTIGVTAIDVEDDDAWFAATVVDAHRDWSSLEEKHLTFLSSREHPKGTVRVVGRSWLGSMTYVPDPRPE